MPYRGGTIINIAGSTPIDDPEYRYKMPAVFGKIEGSGNRTAIPNILAVAKSLHRAPGEVNKFFGTELGARARYSAETDRAIVAGAHSDGVLQDLVHRYIEKFVLCPNCNLPETDYYITAGVIYHRCDACGAEEMVDMSHKLCKFILAEAKKDKSSSKGKDKKKDDKKDKKKKKSDGASDEDKKKDKKDKKKDEEKDEEKKLSSSKKKDKAEGTNGDKDYIKDALLGKKDYDELLNGDDDDEEEEEDSSEASAAGVDDAGARLLAVEATKKYMGENPNVAAADLIEFVTNQQMASALKSQDRVYILIHSVLTPQFFKNKEVEKYSPIISKITHGNRIMERHLISALEALCVDKPKYFPVLIKLLYDNDALEEETILEWADAGHSDYTLYEVDEDTRAVLRGEAEPVVVWLQEADSDEESSEED